jgi:hypothetical protein
MDPLGIPNHQIIPIGIIPCVPLEIIATVLYVIHTKKKCPICHSMTSKGV